ncbi:hypothetical protein AKO1_001411 [Acrasis kona]|uniref:Uncharacterized protein n=1 Tax=Acrasis kona TaxID=1008807 RepID=A0AAW2ZAW4_9EUKA
MKRSYKHYWAIVMYKQSINPFLNTAYVDLSDNEMFSDYLLSLGFGSNTKNLTYLNLNNTEVSTQGITNNITNNISKLKHLNVENAGPGCDVSEAILSGAIVQAKDLILLEYSPSTINSNQDTKKRTKKNNVENYSHVLSKACCNLKHVKLGSESSCVDFIHLFHLSSLVSLNLNKPVFGTPHVEALSKLNNLRSVKLESVQWEKGFSDKQISSWACKLDHLSLVSCKVKDADIEQFFISKPPIHSLVLSGNDSVVGKCFGKLSSCVNLSSLDLSASKRLSGPSLQLLSTCDSLTELNLSSCEIKDAKAKGFLSNIPENLESLILADNDLSDKSLELIVNNLRNLKKIDLSGNINLLNVGMCSVFENVILNDLVRSKSNKAEIQAGVNELMQSKKLRSLSVRGNKLSDLDIKNFNLTSLDVSDNNLGDNITQSIFESIVVQEQSHPLRRLDVSMNRITHEGVSGLKVINNNLNADSCNLRFLNLSNNPCATDNAIMEHSILDAVSSDIYELVLEYATQDGYDSGDVQRL